MAWWNKRKEQTEQKGYFNSPNNLHNEYLRQKYFGLNGLNTLNSWDFSEQDNRQRYYELVSTSAKGNGTIYAIVSRLAGAIGELSAYTELVKNNKKVIEDHPALDLLNNPNDLDTRSSFYELSAMNLLTTGDAFVYGLEKAVSLNNIPFQELMIMPSHEIEIIQGGVLAPIKGFKVRENARLYNHNIVPELNKDNVMFVRLPNMSGTSYYGLSPLTTILSDCDIEDAAKLRTKTAFEQGGRIRVIIPNEQTFIDPQRAVRDLKQDFNDKYKRGQVVVLEYRVDALELGDTNADLQLLDSINFTIERICNVYNFPPDLLRGNNTYENLKEAKKLIYTLAIRYINIINEGLTKFLGLPAMGLQLKLNTDLIEELKPDNTAPMNVLVTMGSTINERRELMGYPAVEGGDIVLIPMGVAPLSDITAPIEQTEKELPKEKE